MLVGQVAEAFGADVVVMDAAAHDAAVARVSHAPQVAASAVAAALGPLGADDVALAGQGLRDVTRIAASEPEMWADIARLNRQACARRSTTSSTTSRRCGSAADMGAAMTRLIERAGARSRASPASTAARSASGRTSR